jgi:two-component system, NtrC family, response regulator HydG
MDPAILIIDDDVDALCMMGRFFSAHPFRVSCVATLQDALVQIDRGVYNAIITDVRLGDSDDQGGLEIVRFARDRSPHSFVVVHTAYLTSDLEREARGLGADVVLLKHAPLPLLAETVLRGVDTNEKGATARATI